MLCFSFCTQERANSQAAASEAELHGNRERQALRAAAGYRRRVSELLQALCSLVSELSRCTEGVQRAATAAAAEPASSSAASRAQTQGGEGVRRDSGSGGTRRGASSGSSGGSGGSAMFADEIAQMTDTLSLQEIRDLLGGDRGEAGGGSFGRCLRERLQPLLHAIETAVMAGDEGIAGGGGAAADGSVASGGGVGQWDAQHALSSLLGEVSKEVDAAIAALLRQS